MFRKILPLVVLLNLILITQLRSQNVDEARLLAIDGQYEEALALFLEMLEDEPDNAEFYYYAGVCYFFLTETEKAIAFLEEAKGEGARFPQAYYWLGQAYFAEADLENGKRIVAEGLELFPRNEKLRHLARHTSDTRKTIPGDIDADVPVIPVEPPPSGELIDNPR